jgi:hypothetical protein
VQAARRDLDRRAALAFRALEAVAAGRSLAAARSFDHAASLGLGDAYALDALEAERTAADARLAERRVERSASEEEQEEQEY